MDLKQGRDQDSNKATTMQQLYQVTNSDGSGIAIHGNSSLSSDGLGYIASGTSSALNILSDDPSTTSEMMEGFDTLWNDTNVIFKDNGFKDDVVKTNTIQLLTKNGVKTVRSI
ncbi:MAG: hypothetical protein ACOCXT_04465 [Candidatus Dojkabacteria bacterium]